MSILPRFHNNSVEEYSTTQNLIRNQPGIVTETSRPNSMALTSSKNFLKLTNELNPDVPVFEPKSWSKKNEFSLFSPNVSLQGHSDEILSCQFSNNGKYVISGGMDNGVLLWDVFDECKNKGVFGPLKTAVTEVKFSQDDQFLYASSADGTISYFDIHTKNKLRKIQADKKIVNSIDVSKKGTELVVSVSNSGQVCFSDVREKNPVKVIQTQYPVLAVAFGFDHTTFSTGGIDNVIKIWDIRHETPVKAYEGHSDSITSLSMSHEGSFLLSNSMDNSMKVWDMKPESEMKEHLKSYKGHLHGPEKNLIRSSFNFNGQLVASGSTDGKVLIWDTNRKNVLLTLGGHEGIVNQVCFSPKTDIIASCSADKTIILTQLPIGY